tara:strand:- start:3971 stop:5443 length:1473 start_codon:yes stop_codon:yes gene_type:complete
MKNSNKNIATVMVTDIVGYSKLTGDNQELALELLSEHDKIILESIKIYHGNVLVNRGDGFVVMFLSSSNAVLCSMDIQTKIKRRNKFNIQKRIFNIRIGVHSGSYSKDGDDYHGECIDIASLLEPLAPHGGILISSHLNSLVKLEDNIYTREYDTIKNKDQMSYEVYLNLLDWYYNKRKKNIHSISEKKYLDLAHSLYNEGNYSGSIKFANSVLESTENNEVKFNILSFLCNGFVALGQMDASLKILKKIKKSISKNIDIELRAHLFKLEAHLFFNNEKWNKAESLYKESYKLLNSIKSKYESEILFYLNLNLFFSNKFNSKDLNIYDKLSDNEFKVLNNCLLFFLQDKKINDALLEKLHGIKKDQLRAYGFWILSKYYGQQGIINKSYQYETKAQDTLKNSANLLSDQFLRDGFLKNILLHVKILSETSVQIDELVEISDDMDDDLIQMPIAGENNLIFKYCVNCGQENVDNYIKCLSCDTHLYQSFYD